MKTIDVSIDGGVGHISLNRPQVLNAINSVMERELLEALAALEADDAVHTLLFSGNGRAFCAGYDLKGRFGTCGGRSKRNLAGRRN